MLFKSLKKKMKEPIDGKRVMIENKLSTIFKFKQIEFEKNECNQNLIQRFTESCNPHYRLDGVGSCIYFFEVGEITLEVDIQVSENKIEIVPYLLYKNKDSFKNIEKIFKEVRVIYANFKIAGLQN